MGGWANMRTVLVLPWLLVLPSMSQIRHTLPVLWIMPLTNNPGDGNLTEAVMPAVQLALDDLRSQPSPLGNYEIQFHLIDSECENANGLKAFFDAICYGPKYFMIFGGVCPTITSTIAESLQGWNLVQLSFAATTPVLADRKKYPNFFRTVPSASAVNGAVVKLLKHYRWSRVGTLTQEGQAYPQIMSDLTKKLKKANIEVAVTESLSPDPCVNLRKLKENDIRIVIGQFDEASKVFCCAYSLNMFGQRYQWIIPSGLQDSWWAEANSSNCTSDSLLQAMEGYISLDLKALGDRQIKGVSGRTPQEYEEMYHRKRLQKGSVASKLHGFAYDGTWVIAKALTQVTETLRHKERYNVHQNFTITDMEVGQMLLDSMKHIHFEGVTGQVQFRNGERMGTIKLSQFQESQEVVVGEYDADAGVLKLINHLIRFQGLEPPKDQTFVHHLRRQISVVLYSILASATMLALLMAIIFLFFNIKNRNHRVIKESSPSMNNLFILGVMLTYTSVFLLGLDGSLMAYEKVFESLCAFRTWILSVGFTTAFGALFAKTCRVFTISTDTQTKTKVRQPLVMVSGMLLVDLCILTCWQVVDPPRWAVEEYGVETDASDQDVVIKPFLEQCESTYMTFWLAIVYGYKGLLMVLGCFLAWKTKNLHHTHPVNDVKYTGMSMCNATVMSIVGVSASYLTQNHPNVQFCVVTLVIISCCTGNLCLVFVPKLIQMKADPDAVDEKRRFQCEKENSKSIGSLSLQVVNRRLIRAIIELDAELEVVSMQLQEDTELIPPSIHDQHSAGVTCEAQLCLEDVLSQMKRPHLENINSPEHIHRRLSLQLPILHHAYMPSVGGVNASSSSLFTSPGASVQHRQIPT